MTKNARAVSSPLGLETSAAFFRLTSESIRQMSNDVLEHTTISDVIHRRLACAFEQWGQLDAGLIEDHLKAVPSEGAVRIEIILEEASLGKLEVFQKTLSETVARPLTNVETISVILFDFIAEQESARLAERLGLFGEQGDRYRELLKRGADNVVNIR